MALSDTKARKAKSADRDYKLTDEKGLHLLVRSTGSKLWRHRYRFGSKEKTLSYGPYPEVTLAEARALRDASRTILREVRDPMVAKKQKAMEGAVDATTLFAHTARAWHASNAPRWTPRHASNVLDSLERDVFPDLGDLPLSNISAPGLLKTLRKVEARGSLETARRVRQRVSKVFAYAISEGLTDKNPAAGVVDALQPARPKRRQPAISDLIELRELLNKADRSGAFPVTLLASRLLALTAVRPGNVREARWCDLHHVFDGGPDDAPFWHIPAASMKLSLERKGEKSFDHVVPLAPASVDVLRAAHRLTGRGQYVFPGVRHAHRPLSENAIGYLYNRIGWHGRHVPHGWRAAFSTIMNERAQRAGNGTDRAVIDLMLAHVPDNEVEAAYNRAQFMPRRRELAEEWADMLMEGLAPAEDLLSLIARRA